MTSIKKNAGLLKSARNWGALGLVLALAVPVGVGSRRTSSSCVTPPSRMVASWRLNETVAARRFKTLKEE